MKWLHGDLALDLAGHLRGPGRMVWTDIQLGPAGSPRPDVYTLDRSFVRPHPTAYEVKVSTADFRSDVTAGKWTSYRRYACRVVFAVPAGLVAAGDIPQGAGLMVRGETGWRLVKKAVIAPIEIPQDAFLKLLIDGVDRDGNAHRHRVGLTLRQERAASRLFGDSVALQLRDAAWAPERIRQAEEEAADILERARTQREKLRQEQAEGAGRRWQELTEILDLPPTADPWAVRAKIAALRAAANGGTDEARIHSVLALIDMAASDLRSIVTDRQMVASR